MAFTPSLVVVIKMLFNKEWRTFEDALLRVSSRNENGLEVAVICSSVGREDILDYNTFLPLFREVGNVRLEFPAMAGAPAH